jgi:hypothetical protein
MRAYAGVAAIGWIGLLGCAASGAGADASGLEAAAECGAGRCEDAAPVQTGAQRPVKPSPGTRGAARSVAALDATVEVDLCDDWAPRVLSPPGVDPPGYRAVFVALANERLDAAEVPRVARRDRYFELYGISPSPSVLVARLAEGARHACHDDVDDEALAGFTDELRRDDKTRARDRTDARTRAVRAAEAHLACDGLIPARYADGVFNDATRGAVRAYQRRHAILGDGDIDPATRAAMLSDSRELDVRAALRMLRERVVDATGLLADGSASQSWQPVLGRMLDPAKLRGDLGRTPIDGAAPDRIAAATDMAARQLGWTDAASIEASLRGLAGDCRVSLRTPPAPAWQRGAPTLRAEIDRGDVWRRRPRTPTGTIEQPPALTVWVTYEGGKEALVRWPTTIGGWERQRTPSGKISMKYMESEVGRFAWREVVAAPAWFPPPSTPDDELVLHRADGGFSVRQDTIGPSYRSAYGLAMMIHVQRVPGRGGAPDRWIDHGIRTHGTSSYLSVYGDNSHGCHRLPNHLALRLSSFVLRESPHAVLGAVRDPYGRSLYDGKAWIRRENRGFVYRLDAPVTVDVLEGRLRD